MTPDDFTEILAEMRTRADLLEIDLADPGIYADRLRCRTLNMERNRLGRFFSVFDNWKKFLKEQEETRQMLQSEQEESLHTLLEEEMQSLSEQITESEKLLSLMLLGVDTNDGRNAIVEIRCAAGGEESALFAASMFRLYTKYAENRGWKYELLELSETGLGGVKEVIFSLSGEDVFSRMKFESGVHRVQRVPVTESSGRIHTSTITVSVLPEAEEVDHVEIRSEDLEISTFRSSGPGGQNVNRTDSAVRICHKPSGITVASQQERSQIRNREIAPRILKTKLLEIRQREENSRQAQSNRLQIGSGDRSERIRTYNFPQNRVTDHRYNISSFDLPSIMEGEFERVIDPILALDAEMRFEALQK